MRSLVRLALDLSRDRSPSPSCARQVAGRWLDEARTDLPSPLGLAAGAGDSCRAPGALPPGASFPSSAGRHSTLPPTLRAPCKQWARLCLLTSHLLGDLLPLAAWHGLWGPLSPSRPGRVAAATTWMSSFARAASFAQGHGLAGQPSVDWVTSCHTLGIWSSSQTCSGNQWPLEAAEPGEKPTRGRGVIGPWPPGGHTRS